MGFLRRLFKHKRKEPEKREYYVLVLTTNLRYRQTFDSKLSKYAYLFYAIPPRPDNPIIYIHTDMEIDDLLKHPYIICELIAIRDKNGKVYITLKYVSDDINDIKPQLFLSTMEGVKFVPTEHCKDYDTFKVWVSMITNKDITK